MSSQLECIQFSVNCEFYMKSMQKMNVIAKINFYFNAVSLH